MRIAARVEEIRMQKARSYSVLPRTFYARDPRTVARALLGKLLVRHDARGRIRSGRIVETEAYLENDPAAHSYRGPTPRNQVMFGPAGHAYVYFTYGMHYCMNVSCQTTGRPGAVLLRALEPVDGITGMAKARGMKLGVPPTQKELQALTSGPARLAQALAITRERDNGCDITDARSELFIADDCFTVGRIRTTPRIGISRAVEKKLRYLLADNPFFSI